MTTVYYITGTSRGIGRALVEHILANDESAEIHGFARSTGPSHPRYFHHATDFSKPLDFTKNFFKNDVISADFVLINNAGTLGPVGPVGTLNPDELETAYRINTILPAQFMTHFAQKMPKSAKRTVLNISSGAGRYPYESWAFYCSSKAALDRFSETFDLEQKRLNPTNPIRVFSVAPGIIDTQMQSEIRATTDAQFPNRQKFVDYKNSGQLDTPQQTAAKLYAMLQQAEQLDGPIQDIRRLK